jgi:hypothetical protein
MELEEPPVEEEDAEEDAWEDAREEGELRSSSSSSRDVLERTDIV